MIVVILIYNKNLIALINVIKDIILIMKNIVLKINAKYIMNILNNSKVLSVQINAIIIMEQMKHIYLMSIDVLITAV